MLDKKQKEKVIKKFQIHEGDTGSSQVQIAILTAEIEEIVEHLKTHPKDHSSRRGLLRKVNARRQLLRYLKKEDEKGCEELIKKLKLKQPRAIVKPGDEQGAGIGEGEVAVSNPDNIDVVSAKDMSDSDIKDIIKDI